MKLKKVLAQISQKNTKWFRHLILDSGPKIYDNKFLSWTKRSHIFGLRTRKRTEEEEEEDEEEKKLD